MIRRTRGEVPRSRLRRFLGMTLPLAIPALAGAQIPSYEPLAPQLPASTRALAMGGSYVAARGSETVFYNPAQVGLQAGVATSVERYESASTHVALSAANALGGRFAFGYGVGVSYLTYYTTPVSVSPPCPDCRDDLLARGTTPASSLAGTLAANMRAFGTRWGAAVKYLGEQRETSRAGGFALDVGAARDIANLPLVNTITVALAAQNLGADFDLPLRGVARAESRAELPTRGTLGAYTSGYALGTWVDVSAQAAVSVLRDGFVSPSAGAELSYVPLDGWALDLRAGLRRPPEGSGERPLTLGAGVSLDRFSLDYAFQSFGGSGQAHRVGIRVR